MLSLVFYKNSGSAVLQTWPCGGSVSLKYSEQSAEPYYECNTIMTPVCGRRYINVMNSQSRCEAAIVPSTFWIYDIQRLMTSRSDGHRRNLVSDLIWLHDPGPTLTICERRMLVESLKIKAFDSEPLRIASQFLLWRATLTARPAADLARFHYSSRRILRDAHQRRLEGPDIDINVTMKQCPFQLNPSVSLV